VSWSLSAWRTCCHCSVCRSCGARSTRRRPRRCETSRANRSTLRSPMTPAQVGRRRAVLIRILAVVIVLGVVTAAAELEIRMLVGAPRPERLPLARVVPHPELGWAMVPGDLHYTYDIPVKLNALGFRGPDVDAK